MTSQPQVHPRSRHSCQDGAVSIESTFSLLNSPNSKLPAGLGFLWMTWFAVNVLRCTARGSLNGYRVLERVVTSPRVAWNAQARHGYATKSNASEERPERVSLNVGHSHFISNASPGERWKPGYTSYSSEEEPSVDELEGVSEGRGTGSDALYTARKAYIHLGKLLPTSTHLLKLILPLGNLSHPANTHSTPQNSQERNPAKSNVPPTVMLLHPSQPLSHVGSLIRASLFPANPVVSFRSHSSGGQAFQWSDSTDVGDFIRDAARSAQFFICLTYQPTKELSDTILKQNEQKIIEVNEQGGTKDPKRADPLETVIEVQVPTFADRTRYLRRKLKHVEEQIASMEELKLHCDKEAHRGAKRMAVTGFGMLVVYWAGVARLTFWDYGW